MQTDPNWTNFLYNASTNKLELLDFGASRAYPEEFITPYVRTLIAATRNDRQACHDLSIESYRSGEESMNGSARVMIELRCASTIACDSMPVRLAGSVRLQ
jgi:predicted unusual protein kinase regulating ubiquinone biosynthesis (AarF/ABC1/UbiB family)